MDVIRGSWKNDTMENVRPGDYVATSALRPSYQTSIRWPQSVLGYEPLPYPVNEDKMASSSLVTSSLGGYESPDSGYYDTKVASYSAKLPSYIPGITDIPGNYMNSASDLQSSNNCSFYTGVTSPSVTVPNTPAQCFYRLPTSGDQTDWAREEAELRSNGNSNAMANCTFSSSPASQSTRQHSELSLQLPLNPQQSSVTVNQLFPWMHMNGLQIATE